MRLVFATGPQHLTAAARVAEARLQALGVGGRVSIADARLVVEVPARARERTAAVLEPVGVLRFVPVEDDGEYMKRVAAYTLHDDQARALGITWDSAPLRNQRREQVGTEVYLTGGSQHLQKYLGQLPAQLAPAAGHRYLVEKIPGQPARTYHVDDAGALSITRAAEARPTKQSFGLPGYVVDLRLSPEDGERLKRLTTAQVGKRMAILLDERILFVPLVMSALEARANLLTDGGLESAERMAAILAGGALPAPLALVSEP